MNENIISDTYSYNLFFFFFFSSRRRHTRSLRDWSSDVCSSDLFSETREWYEGKRRALERKKRFYHGVQAATDFVEIRQEGHWKVDLLHHTLNEKGLDTSLAVDMVALQDTYDIALLISGDADGIPGINYVKGRSKHVGVAEFRRGAPADFPTKGASSRLKIAADFVVQVYEADLIRRNLAYRSEIDLPAATTFSPNDTSY